MPQERLRSKLETILGANADKDGFVNGEKNIGLVIYKSQLYRQRFDLPQDIDINNESGFVLPDSAIDMIIDGPAKALSAYDEDSYIKPLFEESESSNPKCDGFEAIVDGRRFLIGRDGYFNIEGEFFLKTESEVVSILCLPLWSSNLRDAVECMPVNSDSHTLFSPKTIEALRSIDSQHLIIGVKELISRYITSPKGMTSLARAELETFFGVDDINELPQLFQAIGLQIINTKSRYINHDDPSRDNLTEVDALMEAVSTSIPGFQKSQEQ